jgi:hypothetical protein
MATNSILGLFSDVDTAASATESLERAGFPPEEWEVLSGVPYPHGAFGEHESPHRVYVFPFVGGAAGFAVGLLLTVGTQLAQPLVTGGKPIISIPPMVNVMYEGTLLGAILFTILGVIFESRLPRRRLGVYDPRITLDRIGLLVFGPPDRLRIAERTLREAGATDIVVEGRGHA